MSFDRTPDKNSSRLSLEENQRRQIMSSLIGRFRAGDHETVAAAEELKKIGLHRWQDPTGIFIWHREPKLRHVAHYVTLLREIRAQLYEGQYYFIEDLCQQMDFIENLTEVTIRLARAEKEYRTNHSQDVAEADKYLCEALSLREFFLEMGWINPKSRLQNLAPNCANLLEHAKKEIEKNHNNFDNMDLKILLENCRVAVFYLMRALVLPPDKSQETVEAELGAKLDNYPGLVTQAGFLTLVADLKATLDKLIQLCNAHKERLHLELIYLCRSLASLLDRDNEPTKNAMTNFYQAVLIDNERFFFSSPQVKQLREEALSNFSKIFAEKFPQDKNKDAGLAYACSQAILSDLEKKVYSSTVFIQRAMVSERIGNHFDALIDYSVAVWLIRTGMDCAPKFSLQFALAKKILMLILRKKALEESNITPTVKAIPEEKDATTQPKPRQITLPQVSEAEKRRADKAAKALDMELQREEEIEKKAKEKAKLKEIEKAKQQEARESKKAAVQAQKLQKEKDKAKAIEEARKAELEKQRETIREVDADAAIEMKKNKTVQTKVAETTNRKAQEKRKRKAAKDKAAKLAAEVAKEKEKETEENEKRERADRETATKKADEESVAKKLAEEEARLKSEQEIKVEDPLSQNFSLEKFNSELSSGTIDLLKHLGCEIQKWLTAANKSETQLEIYGSFVLYYLMGALNINPRRLPSDLDLFVQLNDLSLSVKKESDSFIAMLNVMGFRVKEFNLGKDYITFEKILPQGLDFCQPKEKVYPIELTVGFSRYAKSLNPIYFTRPRFFINLKSYWVSFMAGDQSQKQVYIQALRNRCFSIDLPTVLKPSLDVTKVFSRVLKFSDEYKNFFTRDKETTDKLLRDPQTIKDFFSNRLGANCVAFNVEREPMKDSCYLEMAELISRNYFSREDAKPIIVGFLSVLIQLLRLEDKLGQFNGEAEIVMAPHMVTVELQKKFNKTGYPQAENMKKAVIAYDFYEAVVQSLATYFKLSIFDLRNSRVLTLPKIASQGYAERMLVPRASSTHSAVQQVLSQALPIAPRLVPQASACSVSSPGARRNMAGHLACASTASGLLVPGFKEPRVVRPSFWSQPEASKLEQYFTIQKAGGASDNQAREVVASLATEISAKP